MDNLCLDVIFEIVQNLREDLPSLKACSFLSSPWFIASRPLLFHTVHFSVETDDENAIAAAFYDKLRSLVKNYPYICSHIRKLVLRRDQRSERRIVPNAQFGLTSPFMDLAPVVQALSQLPSLHTLSLVGISCTMDPTAVCAKPCTSVRNLTLDSVYYFGDDFAYMSRLLSYFPNVADLEIRRCHGKYWQQGALTNVPACGAQLRSLTIMGSWPLIFWTNLAESSTRSLETLDVSLSWLVLSGAADLAGALRRLLRCASDRLLNLRLDLHVEQKDLEESNRAVVPCSSLQTMTFRVSMDRTGMPSWLYLINALSQTSSPYLRQLVVVLAGPDEYTTGELTPPWVEFQDACLALPSLESVGFVELPGRFRQMKLGETTIRSNLAQLGKRCLLRVDLQD